MTNDILIFKFGALGDIVMATPLIKAINNSSPDTSCTLVTTSSFANIFRNWDQLEIETIDNSSILSNLNFVLDLRRKSYSSLFDLQGNDRSRIISYLSGIKDSVGNHSFPYKFHPKVPWRGQKHIFQRMCDVLLSGGIIVDQKTPFLPASKAQENKVLTWINRNLTDKQPFALLHAGSSRQRPDKRWPYFKYLAQTINDRGIEVVWIGSSDDALLNQQLSLALGVDSTGVFDVLELAELGRHACFAVTNDSGPMHVLSASDIPVFGLFGPSNKERNHALGQGERALSVQEFSGLTTKALEVSIGDLPLDYVIEKLSAEGLLPD